MSARDKFLSWLGGYFDGLDSDTRPDMSVIEDRLEQHAFASADPDLRFERNALLMKLDGETLRREKAEAALTARNREAESLRVELLEARRDGSQKARETLGAVRAAGISQQQAMSEALKRGHDDWLKKETAGLRDQLVAFTGDAAATPMPGSHGARISILEAKVALIEANTKSNGTLASARFAELEAKIVMLMRGQQERLIERIGSQQLTGIGRPIVYAPPGSATESQQSKQAEHLDPPLAHRLGDKA